MVMAPRRMTAAGDMTFEGDVDLEVGKLISKPSALQAELGAMAVSNELAQGVGRKA
jgi:hypothetical protein